jgi:hypothetical protein
MILALSIHVPLTAQDKNTATSSRQGLISVPFVGCNAHGQYGPIAAPKGKNRLLPVTREVAQSLAFYQSEVTPGVLAPRGWHCFGTFGSGGSYLYVSPEPIDEKYVYESNDHTGPAVQFSVRFGDTSGRFAVAHVIARVFPAYRAFAIDVKKELEDPADPYTFAPYPKDRLTYRSKSVVEYRTPAQTEGLGTCSRLTKNDSPIEGVAILVGKPPDLMHVSVRLPSNQAVLARAIISQVERDAAQHSQH